MEILEDSERMKRHESLLEKMKLCMQGEQDPPTVSEFMQWRADFRMALAFKSLYGATPSVKP